MFVYKLLFINNLFLNLMALGLQPRPAQVVLKYLIDL